MADTESLLIFGSILLLVLVWAIYGFLNAFRGRVQQHALEMEAAEKQKANDILQATVRAKEQTLEFMSWELHDNVCQVIAMSGTLLLDGADTDDVAAKDKVMEDTAEQLFALTKDVKELARSLNSKQIMLLGLVGFIEKEIAFVTSLPSRKIYGEFCHDPDLPKLSSQRTLLVCRIVQEAIMNVIKHSEANCLRIELMSIGNKILKLTIYDNGKGFNMEEDVPGKLGIQNMRQRAELLGAMLTIKSDREFGSIIKLHFRTDEL